MANGPLPRSRTNGTNGAHPAGLSTRPVPLIDRAKEDDEPVDLVALQADDVLIDALAAGLSVAAAGGRGTPTEDRMAAVLAAWKAEVDAEPIPELVDTETAVAAVLAARRRPSGRTRHLVPIAAAAAAIVTLIGGVSVGSYSAQPDSVLWPVAKVLYSEKTTSVEAAGRAEQRITRAKQAIAAGQPALAEQELQAAAADLAVVRPEEGRTELVDVQSFLVAKVEETVPGVPTDPGAPLAGNQERKVPPGAAISSPARTGEQPSPATGPAATSGSSTPSSEPGVDRSPVPAPPADPRIAVAPKPDPVDPAAPPAEPSAVDPASQAPPPRVEGTADGSGAPVVPPSSAPPAPPVPPAAGPEPAGGPAAAPASVITDPGESVGATAVDVGGSAASPAS